MLCCLGVVHACAKKMKLLIMLETTVVLPLFYWGLPWLFHTQLSHTHHLSHTTLSPRFSLSHTIFHIPLCHTQLFTYNLVYFSIIHHIFCLSFLPRPLYNTCRSLLEEVDLWGYRPLILVLPLLWFYHAFTFVDHGLTIVLLGFTIVLPGLTPWVYYDFAGVYHGFTGNFPSLNLVYMALLVFPMLFL